MSGQVRKTTREVATTCLSWIGNPILAGSAGGPCDECRTKMLAISAAKACDECGHILAMRAECPCDECGMSLR